MANSIKKGHCSNDRQGKGKNNFKQNGNIIGSIQVGRFLKGDWKVLKKGSHNNHVISTDSPWQHNRPHAINQMKLINHQVGRNHSAADEHSNSHKQGKGAPAIKVLSGKGIGTHS